MAVLCLEIPPIFLVPVDRDAAIRKMTFVEQDGMVADAISMVLGSWKTKQWVTLPLHGVWQIITDFIDVALYLSFAMLLEESLVFDPFFVETITEIAERF